eukprot:6192966-Pleurochrysis_carterae.AAC.2
MREGLPSAVDYRKAVATYSHRRPGCTAGMDENGWRRVWVETATAVSSSRVEWVVCRSGCFRESHHRAAL